MLSLLLLSVSGLLVHAITPQPRADAGCAYMSTEAKIYCYGGQRFIYLSEGGITTMFDPYFVSLNLAQDWEVNTDMQNGWEQVNHDVGQNHHFPMVAVPNQRRLFMDGGGGGSDAGAAVIARYKTAYINTESDDGWTEVIPSRTDSRVMTHTATLGRDNNTIYIWGGYRSGLTGGTAQGEETYPREMNIFNIKEWRWSTGSLAQQGQMYQTAVLVGSSIYYIGGLYRATTSLVAVQMNGVLIFNTDSGEWQNRGIGGSVVPSTRIRHTTTLKPSTGEIIMFGGQNPSDNTQARDDYFYILNTQGELSWRNTTIQEDGSSFGGNGILGHAAVLVENYLFVMFGNINLLDDPWPYNITNRVWAMDVDRWAWVSSVSAITPDPVLSTDDTTPPGNEGGTQDDGSSGSSSTNAGTIAGAVVGGVAGVVIIAAIAFFFIRKKRQQSPEKVELNRERMLPDEEPGNDNSNRHISPASQRYSSQDSSTEVENSEGPVSPYGTEKPDGLVAANDGGYTQRFVMEPVKPDGGG
ncbi:hypothetical protein BDA99DRAFT_587714 [Phascolomyces articulosus]|uniref:Galactose oxidase n=1 Tax=Phascolomyces articulosus TaxID=60185 RepID=A0AAD5JSU1_9FUNG|nr:hypothetical protein BDA99DRAFT_587714 [Phascolomyces articulosus]